MEVVIIGGGITGLLLALRLSKDLSKSKPKITILEQQSQLGGRLFFASNKHYVGGPGFSIMAASSLEVLYRHFKAQLTDAETNYLNDFLNSKPTPASARTLNQCFAVKKEFTPVPELLTGSSEIFTKKEAETLNNLVNNNEYTATKKELESINAILTTIAGEDWENFELPKLVSTVRNFFVTYAPVVPPIFLRAANLELALTHILQQRGVQICTATQVRSVLHTKEDNFTLQVLDTEKGQVTSIQATHLLLAMPLIKALEFLPKEYMSVAQARFIAKYKPVSLLLLELPNFSTVKIEHCPDLDFGDRLLFPTEKIQAFCAGADSLFLFMPLNYEESLQAPAVREALGCLRRAAVRILNAEAVRTLKQGTAIPNPTSKLVEKIVLLPIAYAIPFRHLENNDALDVKTRIDNLYCCGDYFASTVQDPWKGIVNSVHAVSQQL